MANTYFYVVGEVDAQCVALRKKRDEELLWHRPFPMIKLSEMRETEQRFRRRYRLLGVIIMGVYIGGMLTLVGLSQVSIWIAFGVLPLCPLMALSRMPLS